MCTPQAVAQHNMVLANKRLRKGCVLQAIHIETHGSGPLLLEMGQDAVAWKRNER